MEKLGHQESSWPIGQWGIKLEQERSFPVLILQNRLSNGSNHFLPSFVRIRFHPLDEDVIFSFPGFGSRKVATPEELAFLLDREGLPKNLSVDWECIFDDWRKVSQMLADGMADFERLYQYFQGALGESLPLPVNFDPIRRYEFLSKGCVINGRLTSIRGLGCQQEQVVTAINDFFKSKGSVSELTYPSQNQVFNDYQLHDHQWLGIRIRGQLKVAVTNRSGVAIDMCEINLLPSFCSEIFAGWQEIADLIADLNGLGYDDFQSWLIARRTA